MPEQSESPIFCFSQLDDSTFEMYSDFYGLPSTPISIYRTGVPWPRPTGPEAYRVPKEARPIFTHPMVAVWRELGRQVYEYLDSIAVKWTSIDPIRFVEFGRETLARPLFLWVGVMPGTLSRDDAKVAAVGCKQILAQFQITDVEISFRESVFALSTGQQLLKYGSFFDPIADVKAPFNPALGLRIAPKDTPRFEGVGGLYICEGGESDRVFILTTRHVVLPPSICGNDLYSPMDAIKQPHRDIILLGSKAFQEAFGSIMTRIGNESLKADYDRANIQQLEEGIEDDSEDDDINSAQEYHKNRLKTIEKSIQSLYDFHGKISRFWTMESQRVLGHIAYAPPISVGTGDKRYTEDWALVELHREKIDWNRFKGNVLDLDSWIQGSPYKFIEKMYPGANTRSSFEYPMDGLFRLRDVVQEDELRRATTLGANGEECLIVVKNGNATGMTFGRGSGIESFVREYDDSYGIRSTSVALAVYSYNNRYKDGAFSAPGDSGSVVVDGHGGIVGIIIGGAGKADETDVTYLSPYYWVEERIKAVFPNAHLYPIIP